MTSLRGICPQGERSESIPPLTAIISDKSLYESTGFFLFIISHTRGMRTPDRGLDNRRQPGGQMTSLRGSCPQGERSESIPPSPPSFQMRACTKVRAFFFYNLPPQGGMGTPDRVRQPAPAGWTDDEPARTLPFPILKSLGIDGNGMLNPQISSGSSESSQATKTQQHIVAHL